MAKTPTTYTPKPAQECAPGEPDHGLPGEPDTGPPEEEEKVFVYVPPSQQSAQHPVAKPGEPMQGPPPGLLTPTPAVKSVPGKSRKV